LLFPKVCRAVSDRAPIKVDSVQEAIQRGAARPNAKVMTNAMPRRSQPTQRNEPSGFPRPEARNAQNFQRNYARYLALARAEALAGDRIVAENYFQHAEHYFRSMGENPN
jgi:hypothetical protein